MKKLPKPPMNASYEAVRLREAALAFARGAKTEPGSDDDVSGQRRNLCLLAAALDYAGVARGEDSRAETLHTTYGTVEIVDGKKQRSTFAVPAHGWRPKDKPAVVVIEPRVMARVQGLIEERWPRCPYNVWISDHGTLRHVAIRFRGLRRVSQSRASAKHGTSPSRMSMRSAQRMSTSR